VVEVHDVESHRVESIITDGVVSTEAKFEPLIVRVDLPVVGAFVEAVNRLYAVIRGASKLNSFRPVPRRRSTSAVTDTSTPVPLGLVHEVAVDEVQLDVTQTFMPMDTVGDRYRLPKLAPSTDTVAPALVGPLYRLAYVSTGPSYEKAWEMQPTMPSTVTANCFSLPTPGAVTHSSAVFDVHVVVVQRVSLTRAVGLKSVVAKFKPETETSVDPDVGAFVLAKYEMTLASYEKIPDEVAYACEITMLTPTARPIALEARHATLVAVVQLVVVHCTVVPACCTRNVGV
jgi:hypothetical protein